MHSTHAGSHDRGQSVDTRLPLKSASQPNAAHPPTSASALPGSSTHCASAVRARLHRNHSTSAFRMPAKAAQKALGWRAGGWARLNDEP